MIMKQRPKAMKPPWASAYVMPAVAVTASTGEIKADYSEAINDPIYKDAKEICDDVLSAFADGEVEERPDAVHEKAGRGVYIQ